MEKKQINFKFAKNWATFVGWANNIAAKTKLSPSWDMQSKQIQSLFESTVPAVIDWKRLWKEFGAWYSATAVKKGSSTFIVWSEQQRQIETLLLNQLKDLDTEIFVLAYLHKGVPEIGIEKMTYWDTVRTKKSLDGDSNGRGGDEDVDKVTIVNLKNLIG